MYLISRVVGVAPRIKGVEGAPVVVIEGKAELTPREGTWQLKTFRNSFRKSTWDRING